MKSMVCRRGRGSTSMRPLPTERQFTSPTKYRPFFSEQSRLPINMHVWELNPGVSEGSHTHDDIEEVYYFVAGIGVMWADGKEIPVAAGDAVLEPPGCDHGFRNTGDVPLKLVLIWGKPA